ncbi:uncharacterized protein CTRU02_209656 [Colletotrichum truncatum]|uniref:Uncharacterized protein n=1 Tax=Colletotrichum truncatum TaxID=5467 RepID=A0ACC3YT00_COLTU|nr:uncharacterized protein CTRU02_12043 [Colletotrichum truncatum]KAF6785111.1 hypothetical protein CTRU02_12043 [Colletotrichum truncatum]
MADGRDHGTLPSKRSLTPNRPIYSSFNEAHRNIAPPTPKVAFDEDLRNQTKLTPEQVDDILRDSNESKNFRKFKDKVFLEETKKSVNIQTGCEMSPTSPESLSAMNSQSKTADHTSNQAFNASISVCASENEYAFIETSVTSHNSKDAGNQPAATRDPFASQTSLNNFPDASSFYPEDGAPYSPDATDDEFILDTIKLDPKSSPILASLPVLPPPAVLGPQNSIGQTSQTHIDDITKKNAVSGFFNATQESTHNIIQQPIFTDQGTPLGSSVPSLPQHGDKKETTKLELQYDADVSEISEDHIKENDKDEASVSRLNPFHAFSACSSKESEMKCEQIETESKKLFMRPHAEKEVSRALHHATGISQPSSGLIVDRTHPSRIKDLHSSPYKTGNTQETEFYHAPAIQSSWEVTASGVKVPVPIPHARSDEASMQEAEPYDAIGNSQPTRMSKGVKGRADIDMDDDWRTVTDDRDGFPVGTVGRVITGSSIANVSDALLIQNQYNQSRRVPSATTAWWGKPSAILPLPSPSAPFPLLDSLPSRPPPIIPRRQRQPEYWEDIELESVAAPMRTTSRMAKTGQVGHKEYANLPFPLVPREDAARRQAVRRASGLEDQTLSGRVLSPGMRISSTQDSTYALPRPAVRKDSARSLFSRINNPSFDCRDLFVSEHQQNPFRQPEHEFYSSQFALRPRPSQNPRDRASTTTSRKMNRISPQAAAEALAIDQQINRPMSPHLYSTEVLARYRAFHAVRNAGGRGTDSELADMAATVDDLPLSDMAQRRQKIFYCVIMTTTLFLPFVGYIILACRADHILSAITHGECSGLSYAQRRNLRIMQLGGFGVWGVAVAAGLIVLAATRT